MYSSEYIFLERSPELARRLQSRGDGNSIVECKTEGFVSLVTALVVEEVVVEIIADSEQGTAGSVGSCVDTVRTGNPPGERT